MNETEEEQLPPPKECCHRTANEWRTFAQSFGSIGLIVFGLLDRDCPDIPSLPAFLIIFGSMILLMNVLQLYFRTERQKERMEAMPPEERKCSNSVVIVDGLGIILIGFSVWGAVLTLPHITDAFEDDFECSGFTYWIALITILTYFLVLFLVILFWIFEALRWCVSRHGHANSGEALQNDGGAVYPADGQ